MRHRDCGFASRCKKGYVASKELTVSLKERRGRIPTAKFRPGFSDSIFGSFIMVMMRLCYRGSDVQ